MDKLLKFIGLTVLIIIGIFLLFTLVPKLISAIVAISWSLAGIIGFLIRLLLFLGILALVVYGIVLLVIYIREQMS